MLEITLFIFSLLYKIYSAKQCKIFGVKNFNTQFRNLTARHPKVLPNMLLKLGQPSVSKTARILL